MRASLEILEDFGSALKAKDSGVVAGQAALTNIELLLDIRDLLFDIRDNIEAVAVRR